MAHAPDAALVASLMAPLAEQSRAVSELTALVKRLAGDVKLMESTIETLTAKSEQLEARIMGRS